MKKKWRYRGDYFSQKQVCHGIANFVSNFVSLRKIFSQLNNKLGDVSRYNKEEQKSSRSAIIFALRIKQVECGGREAQYSFALHTHRKSELKASINAGVVWMPIIPEPIPESYPKTLQFPTYNLIVFILNRKAIDTDSDKAQINFADWIVIINMNT